MSKEYLDVPFEIKASSLVDDGTFEGYASVFGGDPDSYGDIIVKGAFKDSLAAGGRNGTGIAMLWQHKSEFPIGVYKEISEDKKGLYIVGKLTRGVQKADEAHLLMKDGALKGLSIGYDVQDYSIEEDKKLNKRTRYLKKVELWEISPVTFPAAVRAQITNVKAIEEAKTERELEAALRDAGLSIKESALLVSRCKPYLRDVNEKQALREAFKELRMMNVKMAIHNFVN